MNKRIKNKKMVEKYGSQSTQFFVRVKKYLSEGRKLGLLGGMSVGYGFQMSDCEFFPLVKTTNISINCDAESIGRYNRYWFKVDGIKYFTLSNTNVYLKYFPEKAIVANEIVVVDGIEYVKKPTAATEG